MSSYSTTWGQEDKAQIESNDLFITYKTLLEKKTNLQWHAAYLQKYISENIVPFGLRLKLFPHFKNPRPEFKKQWEDILTDSFLSLMSLLVIEHQLELACVDKEINDTFTALSAFKTTEGYLEMDKKITDSLARLRKNIISTKERKLLRDRRAFMGNKAYIWPNTHQAKPFKSYFRSNYPNDTVHSDSSSLSSAPSTSNRVYTKVKKHQNSQHDSLSYQKRRNINEHVPRG